VNRLKDQNKTIDNLTAELAQQRADATQAQSKHVKWQEQLREKLATYIEDYEIRMKQLTDSQALWWVFTV
jgi:hypothetical protein